MFKVVDPDTEKLLGPNERGELRIKGKSVMSGYHNKPEESKKAFDSEGYLYTGDIAYYDEDYSFYIVDRIKDLLKYQSWHVGLLILHKKIRQTNYLNFKGTSCRSRSRYSHSSSS